MGDIAAVVETISQEMNHGGPDGNDTIFYSSTTSTSHLPLKFVETKRQSITIKQAQKKQNWSRQQATVLRSTASKWYRLMPPVGRGVLAIETNIIGELSVE